MIHRTKRHKDSKGKAQTRHAKMRALQRFGISLDVEKAISDIQNNRATFLERQSNRLTVWLVEQQEKQFPAIYDSERKTIVTVLPDTFLRGRT